MIALQYSAANAATAAVFNSGNLEINSWHLHASRHTFTVTTPGAGSIVVTKTTPNLDIEGGYLLFNLQLIPLPAFRIGQALVFSKDISLKDFNTLYVFLGGTPKAAVNVEVRSEQTPVTPPTATFSADPEAIETGDISVLSWSTTNANANQISIDNGIGAVPASGTIAVTPEMTTAYTLTATNAYGTAVSSATIRVYPPPTAQLSVTPQTINAGQNATLTWHTTNADNVTIDPGIGTVQPIGSIRISPLQTSTYTLTASGPVSSTTATVTVNVNQSGFPPTVSLSPNNATIAQGGSVTLSWNSYGATTANMDCGIGTVPIAGSRSVSPSVTTTYTLTVIGPEGTANVQAVVHVTAAVQPQSQGSFGKDYENLIPSDSTVTYYEEYRFAVITGEIRDNNKQPLSEVLVQVLQHPEYGTVRTDSYGRYRIPVEGGSALTVTCRKEGYLDSQRQINVPWNDIAQCPLIVMTALDSAATQIRMDGSSSSIITHRSTTVSDASGSRACTMVFTGDTQAYLADANGNNVQRLSTIVVRATEFTTPESMPAQLPPNSGFTYCAELSADGAERVKFDKPVVTWVDNFLGFPVGSPVPVGFYDKDKSRWVPADNGIVIRLLDTNSDGVADALDATGEGLPDDLNSNGNFADEVQGLTDPAAYPPNTTFWRVALTHFTPWDYNWPIGPPIDSIPPNGPDRSKVDQTSSKEDSCKRKVASEVDERSRVFMEDIPIAGTSMILHYSSDRVEGYRHVINVPASGTSVPASLKRIVVKVLVAGRTLERTLDPLPNQVAEFTWDGLDFQGNAVQGGIYAKVNVGFVYDGFYFLPANLPRAFGQNGREITGIPTRQEITRWNESVLPITRPISMFAEGWSISYHHTISLTNTATLYKGDGTILKDNAQQIITTFAGTGSAGFSGDGGPATQARLNRPSNITFDMEGNLFITDSNNVRIRKVGLDGTITTIAGNGDSGADGDGGPAINASFISPAGIKVDAQDNIYIADQGTHRIRKIDNEGIITTFAGNGRQGFSGDNGLAINASLTRPIGLAIDNNGDVYICDWYNHRIRKVDSNGIITTVAGNGSRGYGGDGGAAINAVIGYPIGIGLDSKGNLYISGTGDNLLYSNAVRKVDTSGIITTIAGRGGYGFSGDEGPALEAYLYYPEGIVIDSNDNLIFPQMQNHRVSLVNTVGTPSIIRTIAGSGPAPRNRSNYYNGDGIPAVSAMLSTPTEVALDHNGNLYIAEIDGHRVRKLSLPAAFRSLVDLGDISFSDKNNIGYVLSSSGLHKTTVDLNTGIILLAFRYNEDNKLISITDQFNNQIIIQRDASGTPLSITSPDGLVTRLTIDSNNHLLRVAYPDNSAYNFEYTGSGLLTAKIEPRGNRYEHVFDANGRLTNAIDEEGGNWQYTRTALPNGDIRTDVVTAEGSTTTYLDHTDSTGRYTSTITDPTGSQTVYERSADGLTVNKNLACGMSLNLLYNVDPEYKYDVVRQMTETSPALLARQTVFNKTYQDTNSDQKKDLITETVAVNSKTFTSVQNTLTSQLTATTPTGRRIVTHYDERTLLPLSTSISGLYDKNYFYDNRGRLTSTTVGTRTNSIAYDSRGNVSATTDAEEHTTTFEYDTVGRLQAIHPPSSGSIYYNYDLNGNMTVLTAPSTVEHHFSYNQVNHETGYQPPISGSYGYTYNRDRELTGIRFPSGRQLTNSYDDTRLTQTLLPSGTVDYSYICGSKVGSVSMGTESITYGYDGKLITSETLSGTLNGALNFTYNNDFNVVTLSYAGITDNYSYDNDGLLTGSGAFTIGRRADNGLPESVTGGSLNLTRSFNGYGEQQSQAATIGGQMALSWNLSRDDNGRILSKTEIVNGETVNFAYTYDPVGRLLTVTRNGAFVESYTYDAAGTRTTDNNTLRGISGRSFSYSDEDHLLTAGAASYTYDVDGFLSTKSDNSAVTQYSYSVRGELLSATLPDGRAIQYVHDPLGRHIAKRVNGVIVEKYLWQGLTRLLAVYDGSNNLIQRFSYADGRMPLSMTAGGSTYYLSYDQVGSLRIVANGSGNVVKRIDYDSFGNIISDTAPSFPVPFGFAGGLYDQDTKLVRFGFRDYDPDTGRWTAKDPIRFAGGDTDLYGYVLNDPVNAIDPYGLLGVPIGSIKKALQKVYKEIGGALPKGQPGKFGSPQHGTPKKGYRLDPAHPDAPPGSPESQPHINWWDYTQGKKDKGGRYGVEPIIGGILGFIGSMLDPFDSIAGELGNPEEDADGNGVPDYLEKSSDPCP
jgi:RHS repeat-associated protein